MTFRDWQASSATLFSPRPESAHEARMGEVIGQGVAHAPAELVLPTQDLSYADQSEAS